MKGESVLKRYLVIFVILLIMTGCNAEQELFIANDAKMHSSHLTYKSGISERFTESGKLHAITTNMYSFMTITEWLDNETILYLTDESGVSYLKQFNILSGKDEIFFQIDEPIIDVKANPDHSLFAIEVASRNGISELHFVDKSGLIQYKLNDAGNEYQLHWNHYNTSELLVFALQNDYSINIFRLDLHQKQLLHFDIEHFNVQWTNKNELAYLKWDMFTPSYYAPLYTYDIESEKEVKFADEIITFFSYKNYLLTISVQDEENTNSQFLFYDTKTKTKTTKLEVPILNTYSEQWWIPNHAFDETAKLFYYVRPNKSGDLFQYSGGFSLVAFHVETGTVNEIAKFDEHYPFKVSPDGRWLLFGYQLEKIIDLNNSEVNSLIYW